MLNYREEYIKCFKDKTRIYFIEHYLSTFNAMEMNEVPFKLFPRQKVYLHSCAEHSETISIKCRQSGISTVTAAYICGEMVFAKKTSPEIALCLANKKEQAEELVNKIVGFLDQVPRWMWGSDFYSPDTSSEKNKKSIYIKRNKSYVELVNGSKIYARASGPNASRGISSVRLLAIDEASFIEHIEGYSAARACQSAVADPKCFMISTPNGKDQLYYKTYIQALKGENNFNIVEFKWFQDPRYNRNLKWYRLNKETGETEWIVETVINKKGDVNYEEERWAKLEKDGWTPTSPWLEKMIKSFNNDSQKIAQELLVSFLGSSDNVVPIEVIEEQRKQNVIKITDEWPLRDILIKETWIWEDPNPEHRYICACLPEGEKVLTQRGLVNVENIKNDDNFFNKDGEIVKIKHRKYREAKNEKIYTFKINGILDTISFTSEHPIWSSIENKNIAKTKRFDGKRIRWREWLHNFNFHKAEDIKQGDWLQVPNYYKINEIDTQELNEWWNNFIASYNKVDILNPLIDEEFWWFCGMWLAEGFLHKHKNSYRIETVHNINETHFQQRVLKVINKCFNRKGGVYNRKWCNSVNIYFNHKIIYDFLENTFGKFSNKKNISEWVKYIPQKFKLKLIEGYFDGDGHYNIKKTNAVSVSKKLLCDLQDISFSCGIASFMYHGNNEQKNVKFQNKTCNKQTSYNLAFGSFYIHKFLKLIENNDKLYFEKQPTLFRQGVYFSEDETYIYFRITKVETFDYTGKVYNFETDDNTHSFCGRFIATHNCDPSSGSGDDASSIEIIDVDAIDENGIPYFNQVLEYNGKLNGEEIGGIINNYGRIYNNALVVTDCIGGYGDAVVLTLQNLGYPNLYYDETTALKTYTNDYAKKLFNKKDDDKLPGFRSNALRIQMISNFVELLKNNVFRVRSERVISELDTWIFKNGRPDHMTNTHDDNLTCLAMGLFVLQYYMLKSDKLKKKDGAIAKSWFINNANNTDLATKHLRDNVNISNTKEMARKFNDMLFYDDTKRNESDFLKACVMLGGYNIKKRR